MSVEQLPIVDLWKEEVERARAMSVQEKLEAGGELFDWACQITLSGIRHQNSGISESDALAVLRKRLALARRLESRA